MTTLTDTEAAARLMGASTVLVETLRPLVRAVDGLSEQPHSRPVREALTLAAEHVRIAAVLLEATAEATEPRRSELTRQLHEDALSRRVRDHRL